MMTKLKPFGKLIYLILMALPLFATIAQAQNGKEVLVVDAEGPITPLMLSFIEKAVDEADVRNVEALIIRLDTPGGRVDLTLEIIKAIIASEVPVVVYVWPPGGFAASAGTFITLAGHAAAMAPSTSIGAASPVTSTGEDVDETLRAKVENILVAEIKSLANRRSDKAIEWAEQSITEAKAANADEALELGAIDFIAKDLDDLLDQLDGFTVEVLGDEVTLNTANARVSFVESTFIQDILGFIVNPVIALALLSIGGLAITYEIINPGGYMVGVIGVICMLIGLYGVGNLPINYAGAALLVLAFALFVAELFTPTYGALTTGGIVAFVVGGLMLFDTGEFAYRLPLPSIIGIPLSIAVIFVFGIRKVIQTRKNKPITGQEGLIGAIGTVKIALEPQGSVFVWGERWQATSVDNEPIPAGAQVEVVEVKRFRLKVRKV